MDNEFNFLFSFGNDLPPPLQNPMTRIKANLLNITSQILDFSDPNEAKTLSQLFR